MRYGYTAGHRTKEEEAVGWIRMCGEKTACSKKKNVMKKREEIIELVCGLCVLFACERRNGLIFRIAKQEWNKNWNESLLPFVHRTSICHTHTHTRARNQKYNINWVLINSNAFAWPIDCECARH